MATSDGVGLVFSSPVEHHTVELINERLETWTITLNSTIEYFTEIARCEHALAKAHKKLAASLVNSVTGSTSGTGSATSSPRPESRTNFWLGPLQAYSLQASVGSESISKYAKEETLVRLEALREDFMTRSKEIRDRLYRIQRSAGKEQEGLVRAMKEHERVWVEQLENTAAKAINGEASAVERKDPFLTELHLHTQIEGFLAAKEKLCTELSSLFSETRVLNADCARGLSTCISEHFTVKSKHRMAQMEQMKDVSRGIESVEPEAEWLHALIRSRLDYEWTLAAPPLDGFSQSVLNQISSEIVASLARPRSAGNASPLARAPSSAVMVKPVRIVKGGFVMRPGSTFGPSWVVLFFVLTDSHFLHAYSPDVKRKNKNPGYTIPSADDQLSKKHLADLNQAISSALLGHFLSPNNNNTSIDGRLLEPLFSVHLAGGVSVAVESPNEFVWSLTVPGGSSSFFSRGDKKYTLKSFLEEDMVDWCIALKEAIAAAQAAPAIFHQPQQQQSQATSAAHPTWTHRDYPVEEPEEPDVYTSHAFESAEEETVPQVSNMLAGFSFQSESTSSAKSGTPTFNLENPWDQ